jgi:hypothetical protein
MKACILNTETQIVENIIELDTLDLAVFVPYKSNIELSARHDGEIGWKLLANGEWQTTDTPLTEEQLIFKYRRKRNNLLKKSDRYMIVDFPITEEKRQEWAAYRQVLRDLPNQEDYPHLINWPVAPE